MESLCRSAHTSSQILEGGRWRVPGALTDSLAEAQKRLLYRRLLGLV